MVSEMSLQSRHNMQNLCRCIEETLGKDCVRVRVSSHFNMLYSPFGLIDFVSLSLC